MEGCIPDFARIQSYLTSSFIITLKNLHVYALFAWSPSIGSLRLDIGHLEKSFPESVM